MQFYETIHPKCDSCGNLPHVDASIYVLAVAVPSTEFGYKKMYDVRALDLRRGVEQTGPVWHIKELQAKAANTMEEVPLAIVGDEDSSLVLDANAEPLDLVQETGRAWMVAREQLRIASAAARTAIRYAVNEGVSESAAARNAGVDRMTVRTILGK